ncbi:hypothetical protein LUZ60_002407 [Juncus effusus]|nr:hypothetical protein LUZ60_002407 [Juncus effusus]
MIMSEDPNLVRWGLHLLQDAFITNPNYITDTIHNNTNSNPNNTNTSTESTTTTSNRETENMRGQRENLVENDEVIAYALQQELSQLEASGRSYEPVLNQVWDTRIPVEGEEMEASSSGLNGEEEMELSSSLSIEFTDELDGVVGKRLNQMVPVPHVPRIINNIPTVDEAMTDHERLLERLKLYDLVELKVQGDGNCQFRALSDQFYRTPEHHAFVRDQIVNQLKLQPEIYKGYVPMGYDDYIKKMSKSGEWGDHVTLQAAADSYGVKIFILTSFKDTCYIEILPVVEKSKRIIFLSFWAEVHYNSIYPEAEFPIEQLKKKKKWWQNFI